MSQKSLAELIRDGDIIVVSEGKKVDTFVSDLGEYDWNLVHHIQRGSATHLLFTSDTLENYLKEPKHLYELADFLVQVTYTTEIKKIHIDVDMDVLNPFYKNVGTAIYNGLGQKVADVKNWVPEFSSIERYWNLALCNAVGGAMGSPGYEYPEGSEELKFCALEHAQSFLIGTKEQLKRYIIYANEIEDPIWKKNNLSSVEYFLKEQKN